MFVGGFACCFALFGFARYLLCADCCILCCFIVLYLTLWVSWLLVVVCFDFGFAILMCISGYFG